MLNSVEDNLIIIKDEDGNVYWPEYNLNSIGDLLPGEGYRIKILIHPILFILILNNLLTIDRRKINFHTLVII